MSAYDDITLGLQEIHDSVYVSGKTSKSYKAGHRAEYDRVKAYLDGGAEPSPFPTMLMGKGLTHVERGRRTLAPPPPPPPPPSGELTSGIGWMRWGNGYMPPTHIADYDFVLTSWGGAARTVGAPIKKALIYMSAISVLETTGMTWHYGVTAPQARAMDAILKDANGNELYNAGYASSKAADIGHVGYQDLWIQQVGAKLREHGLDGVFIDDFNISYSALVGGTPAVQYPGPMNARIPSWEAASVAFITKVKQTLGAEGFYIVTNSSGYIPNYSAYNNGDVDLLWWAQLVPWVDGLMNEYGIWHQSIADHSGGDGRRRSGTTDWKLFWDEWMRLSAFADAQGIDYHSVCYSTDPAQAVYLLCSVLLNTAHGTIYNTYGDPNQNPPPDSWQPLYNRLPLGAPLGPKVKNGSRWERAYPNGLVWVDPVAGTAGIQ